MTNHAYKLYVEERGKGRPVILLHGALSTHRYWDPVAELLDDKMHLYLPDMLGFGKSPKPRQASYSMEQLVESLEYTFKSYKFDRKPVLAGHSLGALLALRWASTYPERFSGLVLSAPLFLDKDHFHQQMATLPLEGKWLSNKMAAKIISFGMSMAGWLPTKPTVRIMGSRYPKNVVEDWTRQPFFVFRRIVKNNYFRGDVLADLKKIKPPTRLLMASRDLMSHQALDDVEALCQENKACKVQVVTGSHQVLIEHPETVARVVESLV